MLSHALYVYRQGFAVKQLNFFGLTPHDYDDGKVVDSEPEGKRPSPESAHHAVNLESGDYSAQSILPQ